MIEKLNVAYIQVESDSNAKLELANKINELVDAVNKLQDIICQIGEWGKRSTAGGYHWKLVSIIDAYNSARKALEIAKDTFNWIDETYRTGQETEAEIWGKVQLAAQEITALEQKEHFADASKKIEQKDVK